ncbi:Peptidoglycan/LPS O-acetylase OafA/YrhL, contains acyltransferase and SGNH-hydrolase domains [Polaromonas sp. OV174]|uniref:acyltransferase family protein n=1 Tax=Polaromonas sp. OV174 TaxID=1855300 RepID=UPI0008E34989|nr:acyltransferase [Polaromonas sp. OV174]SFC44121.1 Peptidoglycan/LPS O-acetylase OafA/YrhL, contains acyltransferase and SGNH-hydrolase domains [Polaromonas sp. OV174]
MRSPDQRLPGLDALKGLACALIIWHHLAFYGPMSDVLYPFVPELTDWLYEYGRMAVQVFLVVGGFLAASSLAPRGVASFGRAGGLIFRRYRRLVRPYLVALLASVLVTALVRPWFHDDSLSAAPGLWQVLAHVLMLQDVFDLEALSAGVWYVAIDLQLFALSVLIFSLAGWLGRRWRGMPAQLGVWLVGVLAALSLLVFNLQEGLDMTGLYFFGAYALGMLAFWSGSMPRQWLWWGGMALLGSAALLLDFRERLLLALLVAFGLVWLRQSAGARQGLRLRWLTQLGQMSYSVFLIHFPVCLLVNAVVSYFWPTQLLANTLGLFAAFFLSLLAGRMLYLWVELRPPARQLRASAAHDFSGQQHGQGRSQGKSA